MKKRILCLSAALILAMSAVFSGCTSEDKGQESGAQVTAQVTEEATQNAANNGNEQKDDPAKTENSQNESQDVTKAPDQDKNETTNENTNNTETGNTQNSDESTEGKTDYSLMIPEYATGEYKKKDLKSSFNPDNATKIELNGSTISVNGDGAVADGNKVTISAKGTYLISGKLDDGQIIINAGDDDDVRLILNGADITCSNSSPIYAINADKVILTLVEGTVNTFTDGTSYVFANADKEEPNAAIFSDCDLSINGEGTLNVNGNFQHAIRVKADLKITSGIINLNAVAKGIKVKKTFAILDGELNIKCGDDGINAGMAISIDGGKVVVAAEDDGIQSDEQIIVNAGTIDTSASKKGFKAPIFTPNGGDIS
ncbi:MAG: carbohydrate-binding domain-containing protein [Lachnospiraceae bacterium]|nr:carbohydrate-binding domain-containing protein [Lachnospiraceae bacterium]